MMHLPSAATIFLALSALFLALSVRDHIRAKGRSNVARKAWIRVGVIFGVIGVWLYFF